MNKTKFCQQRIEKAGPRHVTQKHEHAGLGSVAVQIGQAYKSHQTRQTNRVRQTAGPAEQIRDMLEDESDRTMQKGPGGDNVQGDM